jgi:hypothetical protein
MSRLPKQIRASDMMMVADFSAANQQRCLEHRKPNSLGMATD